MRIDLNWKRFNESDIPVAIRKDIIKAIGWIEKGNPFEFDVVSEELYAQAMINIYLIGVNHGLKLARLEFEKNMKSFGHHGN